jgi:glycosyltransferase involved in cell wall biosynthesis
VAARVCFVTTTPYVVNAFLKRHLAALAERYDVTLAVNTADAYHLDADLHRRIRVVHVAIERKISPLRDLGALLALTRLLRRGGFDAVHTIAPKAGLLGIVAAWLARVPRRIHTFQGEVWAARRGAARAILKAADRLLGRLLTHALVVGRGEQSFLEKHGVLRPGGSTVLLQGSIAGVDPKRFHPDDTLRARARAELGIAPGALAIMYVGRIARDKGVLDLAKAFARLEDRPCLVLVGPDEEGLRPLIERACGNATDRLRHVDFTTTPERYMVAADVVCLPSYREGFGMTLIEAGACGVPVVASRLYGTEDSVAEGVTGLLHAAGDAAQLEQCLRTLADDPALRRRLGDAGRSRALAEFRPDEILRAFLDYYTVVLGPGR